MTGRQLEGRGGRQAVGKTAIGGGSRHAVSQRVQPTAHPHSKRVVPTLVADKKVHRLLIRLV